MKASEFRALLQLAISGERTAVAINLKSFHIRDLFLT